MGLGKALGFLLRSSPTPLFGGDRGDQEHGLVFLGKCLCLF
jgi:hypothetical protein